MLASAFVGTAAFCCRVTGRKVQLSCKVTCSLLLNHLNRYMGMKGSFRIPKQNICYTSHCSAYTTILGTNHIHVCLYLRFYGKLTHYRIAYTFRIFTLKRRFEHIKHFKISTNAVSYNVAFMRNRPN